MASQDFTNAVVASIFGEIPPNYSPDDHNVSNDSNPTSDQHLNDDDLVETHVNSEEAEEGTMEIEPTNPDQEYDELVDEGPQVGQIYESKEHLKQAYKAFGKMKGFGVSIRNCRPNYVIIACDRGRKGDDAKKSTKRVDCQAKIIGKRDDMNGFWIVNKIETVHNHELDPDMSQFMAGHRSISLGQKRRLENVDISGVPVCKNIQWLQVEAGGPGNLGCSSRDCRNFIDARRRLRLGDGDAAAIHNLFLRLQQKDPNFFHLMDIDDDCRLRNVMWIHPRSRAAYEDFHDVISFDTTYLVNRYQMPFATVIGVNQHHQSILLGCALLTHEQSESFKWFFSNWLQAMGGVEPTAILTDQCDSIKNALKEVMPNSIHRYCIWHILFKLSDKFKGIPDYNKTATAFKNVIYDSLSITEFERRWGEFITEYGMGTNKWLEDMYNVRDRWVPIYLNHMFWAGMLSTQRSESMHAFFDSYINSRSTLKSFVEQYEIAITNKTHKELEADYHSKCTYMKRRTQYAWEEQFGRVYTNNVFRLLQNEIDKVMNCNLKQLDGTSRDVLSGIERYEILELGIINNWYHKEYVHKVEHRTNGGYLKCSCRKFDSKGIFCCHILKVLVFKGIGAVNERYILRRWRKDVYRPHSKILFCGGYPHMTKEYQMFREFESKFEKCNEIAYNKPARMELMKKRLDELANELSELECALEENDSCSNETEFDPGTNITVLDPNITKRRGRPKTARLKSTAERNRERATNNRSSASRGRGGRGSSTRGRGVGRGPRNDIVIGTQGSVAN